MELFSYFFAVSMLHSIWQSALLLLVYLIITSIFRNLHPSAKRNLLFILLVTQLSISVFTFVFYYNNFFGSKEAYNFSEILFDQSWLRTYAVIIFDVYILAFVYQISKVFYTWLRFRKKCRHSLIKPPVELKMFMLIKADLFGIKRKVTLWLSNAVTSPVTFGFWKPVILMPVALLNQLSVAEAEALIVHELTHIRNNDFVLNVLLIITEAIYFFNPFIKIISKKIKLEREKNCDIKVLDFNYHGIHYAETLLKIARESKKIKGLQLGAVMSKTQLLDRIQYFSQGNLQFSRNNKLVSFAGLFLAIIINLFILLQARNNNPERDSNNSSLYSINSIELTEEVIANDIFPAFIKEEAATPARQKSTRKVNKVNPGDYIESTEGEDLNYAIAAGNHEEEIIPGKELIVNEEDSSGKITSAYNVQFKNGEWVIQPLWMLSETKLKADSIKNKAEALMRFFNTIQ